MPETSPATEDLRQSLHATDGRASEGGTLTGDVETAGVETALAGWLRHRERSILRRMVNLVARPGVLSLAGGLPEPSLFPRERIAAAYATLLREDPRSLQYGGASERLKEQVVGLAARRGITATPENVVITTGAQQGIDIAVRAFLEQGGEVLLDEVSYTGVYQAAASRSPKWCQVPVDLNEGSDDAAASKVLERRKAEGRPMPDLAYLISDAHNPLGVSISEERREGWAKLLVEHQIPLLEDDPYGLLWLDKEFAAPMKSRIPEWTIYLGSFSKILAPGLRLGFMIVPSALQERLGVVKESSDLESSGLTQRAVAMVLEGGFFDDHLERVRSVYRSRRDALLEALDRHMPKGTKWTRPGGGLFVWVELDRPIDTEDLLRICLEKDQVAFLPGIAFAIAGSEAEQRARRSMRMSFSSLSPEKIDRAVAGIARHL